MPAVKQVYVHCGLCRTRFPCHLQATDAHAFERLAQVGGVAECPGCHHFVTLDRYTLSYGGDSPGETGYSM